MIVSLSATLRLLSILILTSMGVSAQQATVTGTVPSNRSGKSLKLTLINYETRNDKLVQETIIGKAGQFTIMIKLKEPGIYELSTDDIDPLQIMAKPGDKIHLKVSTNLVQVSGSRETQYLIDYEANRKIAFNKYLKRTYDSSAVASKTGDKQRIEYWNAEHEKATEAYKAELAKWVKQPFFINSLVAIHHSIRWNSETDTALMNQMLSNYLQKYPKYSLTRQLANKVTATKRIAIGSIAPDFSSTDLNGKKIKLSDYRGKYTLVDFWASWCAPCREESPTLVRLYKEYKAKGFEILSISIDKNTTFWKNAMRHDGYSWDNICDLNGYAGPIAALYTVTSIPNSFLLDKNGKIIAKNLRGKKLETKLAQLMK